MLRASGKLPIYRFGKGQRESEAAGGSATSEFLTYSTMIEINRGLKADGPVENTTVALFVLFHVASNRRLDTVQHDLSPESDMEKHSDQG